LAARLAADERIDAARQKLDAATKRCTGPESTETLAGWRKQFDQLPGWFEKDHREQEAAALRGYVDTLRQRHRKAADRGDQEAASRYEQLLTDAGAKIE
jgi:hypothetical protein